MPFLFLVKIFSLALWLITPITSYAIISDSNGARCDDIRGGGAYLNYEEHIELYLPEVARSFEIQKNEDFKETVWHDDYLTYKKYGWGSRAKIVKISNLPARKIFTEILKTYSENGVDSCRVKGVGGGIIYANGITCRRRGSSKVQPEFRCTLVVYDGPYELKWTSSALIPLARPRMGAGNALELYLRLKADFPEN